LTWRQHIRAGISGKLCPGTQVGYAFNEPAIRTTHLNGSGVTRRLLRDPSGHGTVVLTHA